MGFAVFLFPPWAVVVAQVEGLGYEVGPGFLITEIALDLKHADNLFQVPEDETSTAITNLVVDLQYELELESSALRFGYLGDAAIVHESREDDYFDSQLTAGFALDVARNVLFRGTVEYQDEHDARGTFRTQGRDSALSSTEPDEWRFLSAEGQLQIGTRGSMFRVEAGAQVFDKEYLNNPAQTVNFNRSGDRAGIELFYNALPSTDLVVEAQRTENDYDTSLFDSTNTWLAAGVDWEVTDITKGSAKYGRREKDFDDSRIEDFAGGGWEIELSWQPRTYSSLTLSTVQETVESNGFGSFVEARFLQTTWVHDWPWFLRTIVYLYLGEDQYFGAPSERNDDIVEATISMEYQVLAWLALGGGITRLQRDSSLSEFDFDSNILFLGVKGAL